MVLIAYLDWRDLADEVLGCEYSKDHLILHFFAFVDEFVFWFCCEILDAESGLVYLLLNWHDRLDKIAILQLMGRCLSFLDQRATQRSWPNVPGGIIGTYTFSSCIFQPVINRMRPPHLLDDGICVSSVIDEITWLDLEHLRLLIEQVLVVLDALCSVGVHDIELFHQLFVWRLLYLSLRSAQNLLLQVLFLFLFDIFLKYRRRVWAKLVF